MLAKLHQCLRGRSSTVPYLYQLVKNKGNLTAQKKKFFIKDFFRKLRIWSHLLKESLVESFIFVQCLEFQSVEFLVNLSKISMFLLLHSYQIYKFNPCQTFEVVQKLIIV